MYHYHANALGLGGRISRPLEQVIESQAATSLASTGGFGSAHIENFNFKNIVSFRVAHSEVAGSLLEDRGVRHHTSRVSVSVEGLNILNVVTADKIVGRLASRHPDDDHEPGIIATGSYFENLKIAGHLVEVVEFAHETFHDFDTYQKLQDAFVAQDKRQEVLNSMLGSDLQPHPADAQHLHDVHQGFSKQRDLGELQRTVLCSVVKKIKLHPGSKEIRAFGPVVVVPRFGTIYLGELIVAHGSKRLNMLRLVLGSPDEGEIVCASGDGNGGGY